MFSSVISRLEYWFEFLTSDPVNFLIYVAYTLVTILLSLILHEIAHGYVALRCGDPTAKWMGRLTLDPRKHLDPLGTISMFLLGVGWAKPVPVNPRNFQNYRRDDFLVSIAGIVTNMTIFIFCAALSVGVNALMWSDSLLEMFRNEYGVMEALVHPNYMVGHQIMYGELDPYMTAMLKTPWLLYVQRFLLLMGNINLSLAVFNLLPIPPLDGFHLLNDTILRGKLRLTPQLFQICHMVLLVLCFSGALSNLLYWANTSVYSAVLNLFLRLVGGA